MSSRFRSTYILLAVFVVLLAVVIFFANGGSEKSRQQKGADTLVFSSSQVNQISAVQFTDGEEELKLALNEQGDWIFDQYQADPDEMEQLLMSVQELTRGKEVSRNKDNWSKYGVTDEEGQLVVFFDADEEVSRFVFGAAAPGPGKYYLRRNDDPTVFEVSTTLQRYTGYTVDRWRNKRLFPVSADQITALEVQIDDQSWQIAEGSSVWEEKKEKVDFYLNDILGLRADAFESDQSLFESADQMVKLTLVDGTEWKIEIDVKEENVSYARFADSEELLRVSADYGIRLTPSFLDGGGQEAEEELETPALDLDFDAEGLEADLN